MMCSTWKISVFGILALMLAFGMTTDALAQDPPNVTIAATGADDLRATDTVTIEFTITPAPHDTEGDRKASTVTITIPAGWSRPFGVNEDTGTDGISEADLNEDGEIYISNTDAASDTTVTGKISGRNLVATVGKSADSAAALSFHYRTLVPHRRGSYAFPLSSTPQHAIVDADADAIAKRGGRHYLDITVGAVRSGAGKATLMRTSGGPFLQPSPSDKVIPHEGKYLLVSEESLSNLVITFEAAGTMPKNSQVTLTLGTDEGWIFTRDDNSQSSVSGNVELARAAQILTATVKAGGIQKGSRIVFTLKGLKAPKVEGTTEAEDGDYDIEVQSLVDPDGDEGGDASEAREAAATVGNKDEAPANTYADGEPQFDFIITKKAGTGKVALTRGDDAFTYVITGTGDLGNWEFGFSEIVGFSGGAQFEIEIPSGLPQPYVAIGDPTEDGAVSVGGTLEVKSNGRKLTGSFGAAIVTTDPTAEEVTYRLNKAPAEGAYTFPVKLSPGPHQPLTAITSPTVQVVGGHGKGTMTLTRNGVPFTQTTSEAEVGNLVLTYTPGGRMAVGSVVEVTIPAGWSTGRTDNGDGVPDRGEITLSGDKATLVVTSTTFTATATKVLTSSDKLVFTYKNVKVRKVDSDSDTFVTKTQSHPGTDLLAEIGASPAVGIGRAPDGGGTLSVNETQADAGSSIGDLVFTFTAGGKMGVGSTVEITIPSDGGWPAPSLDISQPGGVTLGDTISASLATTATTMSATIATELNSGGTIVFTYKNITAPTRGGQYTFTGKSTSSAVGTLKGLQAGVTISIDEVAAGSIALAGATGMLSSAAPGMALGNLAFTFTAGAQMASGAQVQITIPSGWTPPFLDNNDGTDAAGEVSVAGAANLSVSGGGAQPWMLTATTTATLEIGNTLTTSYKQVTAPAAEATYQFMTKSSVASGGTLLPLSSQPNVVVRTPVAAIAVHAMPESVFAGDDVTVTVDLWSAAGELAKSLGSMVVMLDDGDADGSFSDADGNAVTSVTIADNMSSASATYMNGTAGMVTITATSGEMTATVDVEVKSTIRGLSVDNELVTQGATVMVSAIGQAGGGTVVVLDSDGDKVGTKKALDPVGEPDADGDQEYERSITLPAMLADGMYTVSVEIQGDVNNELMIEVVNDQTPPTVSDAEASKMVVMNGDHFTLSANVGMNESMVAIASVTADVSMLDDTQADPVALTELTASPGTYTTIITVSDMNMAEDGEKTITITATDAVGNSTDAMVMVTLENDPSRLDSAEVTPASGKPGETIWIKAMGSAGDDASATVNNAETGMMIAQVTLDEDADNPGMYMAGLMIVEDAHPAGVYDVTVTLGTKMKTLDDALTIEPPGYDFTWSIGAGTHLIHVPLAVTKVNGMDMSIDTVRDLYNALGGDAVNIIISLGADGSWNSYLGDDAPGMAFGDMMIGDSTGLVAVMNSAVTLELTGNALGTGGVSTIMLNAGNNLVGVPLDSAQIGMISDVLGTVVSAVVVSNAAGDGFQTITQAGDPGDGPLMGGEGYIAVAAAAASIPVIGSPWQNMGGASTAPPVASAANVKTPVLHVRGQLVDEAGMMSLDGLTVSVRNVTSGSVLGSGVATDEYSMTFVKLDSSAAKVGDILEIKADSGNPLLGIRPVQHVVTAEDVLNGSISLPDLVTYEIPAQSELLANYPNPFNPETWIPFRLAEDASVSLDIYGASGALVRTIDLGFTPAAVYEGRSDAIYWDGRNNFGEQVSSGLYFYHLRAGEFSATRRMVIVK